MDPLPEEESVKGDGSQEEKPRWEKISFSFVPEFRPRPQPSNLEIQVGVSRKRRGMDPSVKGDGSQEEKKQRRKTKRERKRLLKYTDYQSDSSDSSCGSDADDDWGRVRGPLRLRGCLVKVDPSLLKPRPEVEEVFDQLDRLKAEPRLSGPALEEYYRKIKESEGFDVGDALVSFLDDVPIASVRILGGAGRKKYEDYSQFALDEYNYKNNTNYQFVEYLKANYKLGCCCPHSIYYFTFRASNGKAVNFQARVKVSKVSPDDEITVELCWLEPNPNCSKVAGEIAA